MADKSKLEIYEDDLEHIYEDPNGVQQVKSINQLESLKNVFFRWEDQKLYKINAEWSHWPVSTLQLKINPASCHFLYR